MNSPEDEIPLPSVGVLSEEETLKQLRADSVRQYVERIQYLEGKAARSVELESQLEQVASSLLIANRDLDAALQRVKELEKEVVRQVEEFISCVSHLEGPNHVQITEPGNYIYLIKVFTDRSGHVTEFKKVTTDTSEDAPYPCREWREWMKDRPKWPLIPFNDYADMREKTK